jgi:hypothetical protein
MRRPVRPALLAALGLASMLSASGCAAGLREHTTPFPTGTRKVVPWGLNRELLLPDTQRVQIVVELVEGHPPELDALDDLTAVASRYGERPASWVAHGAPDAPAVHWVGDVLHADRPLRTDTSYVFVRYVGWRIPNFGYSYSLWIGGRAVYLILVNQERHRRWRSLVLPERRLEEQTLVHEYGHMLGLPPCDHGYYAQYPDLTGGAHCINPDCALSKPRFRAVLYGIWNTFLRRRFLDDYCGECRRAIDTARRYWRDLDAIGRRYRPYSLRADPPGRRGPPA